MNRKALPFFHHKRSAPLQAPSLALAGEFFFFANCANFRKRGFDLAFSFPKCYNTFKLLRSDLTEDIILNINNDGEDQDAVPGITLS